MIVRFNTHEEAGLFVAKEASEGIDCVILDAQAASLWGASAVGGVRVAILGERDVKDGSDQPQESFVVSFLRGMVLLIAGIGVLAMALSLALAFYTEPLAMLLLIAFGATVIWIFVCLATVVSLGAKSVLNRGVERGGRLSYTNIAWVIIVLSFIGALLGVLPFG